MPKRIAWANIEHVLQWQWAATFPSEQVDQRKPNFLLVKVKDARALQIAMEKKFMCAIEAKVTLVLTARITVPPQDNKIILIAEIMKKDFHRRDGTLSSSWHRRLIVGKAGILSRVFSGFLGLRWNWIECHCNQPGCVGKRSFRKPFLQLITKFWTALDNEGYIFRKCW